MPEKPVHASTEEQLAVTQGTAKAQQAQEGAVLQ